MIDANTGRVLHAQAADEPRYPASLTKMMTLYIVFDLLERGRLSPSTRIRFSEAAASAAPSKLDLEPGETITVSDAVRALITKSANDVAVALAEHIAGSEARFAELMTQKAHALGMKATVFKNANGLPNPDQVTTARDIVTLALHLNDDFPRYYPLFATRTFSYEGKTFRNHNTLLNSFEGTDGIKTGYTSASGFNVVVSVRRDGKHVIAAVFGGSTATARNILARALLRRALAEASTAKTRRPMLVATNDPAPPKPKQVRMRDRRAGSATRMAQASEPQRGPAPAGREQTETASSRAAETTEGTRARSTPIEIARVRAVPVLAPRARFADVAYASTRNGGNAPFARASINAVDESGRGSLPSSFEAQADRIAHGQPAVTTAALTTSPPRSFARPERAAPRPVASGSGNPGFVIQVGAYSSQSEAQHQLQATRSKATGLLEDRPALMQPVQVAGKQLFRARFSGFDARTANTTCQELKRRQIDCLVAKAE